MTSNVNELPNTATEPPRTRSLRVMFIITSMPVGGAETLLANLIRRLDRARIEPQLCCLKQLGPLGRQLRSICPTHAQLIAHKFDVSVLPKLIRLMRSERIDAVVTVGAGDKMFWGRLAAKLAGVPVICSALHSTGWPDTVGRLNRLLTPLTDAFIGVAESHGRHLIESERFPAAKVRVIPNGVDTERFRPDAQAAALVRHELNIPADAPLCGIVAALRPEKNHGLFLETAALVGSKLPAARFLIVGDGPTRGAIEEAAAARDLHDRVHLLGSRSDVPQLLSAMDVFLLTSHNEANPVSILEAMSVGLPVVAADVGSVHQTVGHGVTGFLAPPGAALELADGVLTLLDQPEMAARFGAAGRRHVRQCASLDVMVRGYEQLLWEIYERKRGECSVGTAGLPCSVRRDASLTA